MIGIGIGVKQQKVGGYGLVAPIATAATGIGQTSFTANWNAYPGAVVYLLDVSTSPTFDILTGINIYENQQVNAPTTSYVVIGLNPNTTYYYRVRASTESLTDPDAQAFFNRVTTAGGSLSATEQTAVNQLVLDLKSYSLWTKMKAIYPMVGASAAACAQNLKSSSFTGTFSTGWTFASTGVTPSSAFMNTGLNMASELSQNNCHISVYLRTDATSATTSIGATSQALSKGMYIYPRLSSVLAYFSAFNNTSGNTSANVTSSLGLFTVSRIASTSEQFFQNTTKTSKANNSNSPASQNIYLGANNNNGTASNYDTRQNAFASIGEGFTDTEQSNFYTAVQAFQTTLNRNV